MSPREPGGGWLDKQTGHQLTGLGGPGTGQQEGGNEEQEPPGVQEETLREWRVPIRQPRGGAQEPG